MSWSDSWAETGGDGQWLTLGMLRKLTADLPDDTPITADAQGLANLIENPMWFNVELAGEGVDAVIDGESPSLQLVLVDTFETRQW